MRERRNLGYRTAVHALRTEDGAGNAGDYVRRKSKSGVVIYSPAEGQSDAGEGVRYGSSSSGERAPLRQQRLKRQQEQRSARATTAARAKAARAAGAADNETAPTVNAELIDQDAEDHLVDGAEAEDSPADTGSMQNAYGAI